jgi:gliding motility-associated-like protein
MRKLSQIFGFLFVLGALQPALATHIVGGEIELEVVSGLPNTSHRVSLNLYFDAINGNPQAEDLSIVLSFFRKRDNALMGEATLPRVANALIPYSSPACVRGDLQTRLIRYSTLILLNEDAFNDPQGYYIVWERCCRNNTITNIQDPGGAGSVFYLEFPSLRRNNQTFVNSSPKFQAIKADYICINQPFAFEFGGVDADGDSLNYQLVTPLNGFSNRTLPNPRATGSSNYPLVRWGSGYGVSNVIPGRQALRIDAKTGLLTVNAGQLGLFVFSVLVQEYRNKVKIGEVRRDFQLKVVDCQLNDPPKINLRESNKTAFYVKGQTIKITAAENRCLNLLITDINPNQRVNLQVKSAAFTDKDLVLTPSTGLLRSTSDTLKAQLCLGSCVESINGREILLDLIASDDGCPLPKYDTLPVRILVEPRTNARPTTLTDLPNNQATVLIGSTLRFNVNASDTDRDSLRLEGRGRGFVLSAASMTFANGSGVGSVRQPFAWTPTCNDVGKTYTIDFVTSENRCGRIQRDSVSVRLNVLPRPSMRPEVSTSLANPMVELIVGTAKINFDVTATDPDKDPIQLYAVGRGFDLPKVGMKFENKNGIGSITTPFEWVPDCADLQGKTNQEYVVDFITEDNSCSPTRFDTVTVKFVLKDLVANYDITPPNVFTPNADGKNDYFAISNLPPSNCQQQLEGIEIFNRWGQLVFQSQDKDFRWLGDDVQAGEYYYQIRYTRKIFKGVVTLLR